MKKMYQTGINVHTQIIFWPYIKNVLQALCYLNNKTVSDCHFLDVSQPQTGSNWLSLPCKNVCHELHFCSPWTRPLPGEFQLTWTSDGTVVIKRSAPRASNSLNQRIRRPGQLCLIQLMFQAVSTSKTVSQRVV